ncbi:magnesium chelatase ATPase subunit D [Roseiflexus castenholzii]|uniref:magnesium chelatase ATPase subunit D n=1 Tax=Roseiflexus castenholzii TaxID=120962 RepID=UPI003C7B2793
MSALPLPALVGLELAQQALLLLAVEPRLRGIAVGAPAGAGKSSLARGMRDLLCSGDQSVPFVELPLGVDEAGLLGGLDIEATLRAGRRVARAGALARATGGILYADQVNLLPDAIINPLIAAIDTGEVRLEREGLSVQSPARFVFIGSYDPAEGLPRRHLLDRLGLLLVLPRAMNEQARTEVVRRNLGQATQTLSDAYVDELDLLRGLVQAAREQLPQVRIDDEQVEQLVAMAALCGVEGHRADTFAVYAACAAAAIGLRDHVEQEDLELAVRLVILPRATRLPPPPEPPSDDEPPPPPPPSDADNNTSDAPPEPPSDDELTIPPEQVLSALAAELPVELEQLPFRALRRGKTGSRGTVAGKRGRHIRSIPGDPRRGRIDVSATLRAAAPFQPLRRAQANAHAAPSRVLLRSDDLRIKQYRSKAGALFLFAVDASGSMALHRMRQAKGAVQALLQKAYVHRDRVALLAFRGQNAELLLPPSQSVELARRALDLLPTGGGTPLAAALLAAIEVAQQARARGIMQTVLVLLTDGRANIGLRAGREGVADELQTIGRAVVAAGIQTIVVDTQRTYLSRGEARKLAEWLAGEYVYLPNAQGEQIAALAVDRVER